MAETLTADSHRVFGGVRDLAGRNSAAAEALRRKGVEVLALDATSDADVEDGIKSLLARSGGKLDVVINNADVFSAGVSESFTTGQLHVQLLCKPKVHLKALGSAVCAERGRGIHLMRCIRQAESTTL